MTITEDSIPSDAPTTPMESVEGANQVNKPSTEEIEEPQNPLTKQFTEQEWVALREFREELPSILEEASNKPIVLWGVPLSSTTRDARVSVILMKFLRARELKVLDAKAMLIAALKWREEYRAADTVNEEFPKEIFGKLGHISGKDKEGRPVTYNIFGGNQDLKAVFEDVPRFLRWRVALMEKGMAALDFEKVASMIQVHDYAGVGFTSRDANSKRAATEASTLFGAYYPDTVFKKFFVNVPAIFNWVFYIFSRILPARTVGKMSVVGTGPNVIGKELLIFIDKDQLPKSYGGEADDL